jgi:hypothetical protein
VSQGIVKANPLDSRMDNWAVAQLIDWAAGTKEDSKTKATLKDELCEFAAELAGPTPSPVETVLANAAATNWFALRMFEAQYSGAATSGEGMRFVQSEHDQRRIDRAHRRFLSTLQPLATARRLALPAVQINVARQPVNQLNARGS